MSSFVPPSSLAVSQFPTGLALLGGIPIKGQDLAASIVFAVAYFLLLPVAIWRLVSPASRCWTLVRPSVFIVIRIATFIIRAIQSNGNYELGLFIAEQITLLCGFVLLCEPLITLLGHHITRTGSVTRTKGLLTRVLILLRIALLVALALGVYAGSKFGSLHNQDDINTVKDTRTANAVICVVITALGGFVALVVAHMREHPALAKRHTLWLFVVAVLLTIVSAYKIYLYEKKPVPSSTHRGIKISFYLLVSLPEIIVSIMYLAINMNEEFNIPLTGMGRGKAYDAEEPNGYTQNGGGPYAYDAAGKPMTERR